MVIRYGTVCSGIEAPSVAWGPLGWKAQWFSEIEKFPKAVIAHHYPSVPDLGDMTKVNWDEQPDIDVLIGGTPCQSFSVAGLRAGLADPRGNLALEFLKIVDRKRPRWFVWENVPGVLSSNGGRDFGAFLGAVEELGYGFCYRVMDARYISPMDRKRVYVIGNTSGWRSASAVLGICEKRSELLCEEQAKRGRLPSFKTTGGGISLERIPHLVFDGRSIRKLTPLEWERCFGFPDNYTRIPWKDKYYCLECGERFIDKYATDVGGLAPAECPPCGECDAIIHDTPDGHRYKALGNSMAVPVIRWLGERIQIVDEIISGGE